MTSPRGIWRTLNGKLDALLRNLDAVGPKLDRAIGEAQAARAECRMLRERIAQLEVALDDRLDESAVAQRAAIDAIREEVDGARREHVSLAEGINGLQDSAAGAIARLDDLPGRLDAVSERMRQHLDPTCDRLQRSLGRVEGRQLEGRSLEGCEFQVYSQAGEDGILWKLAELVPPERRSFVEFGVEDYREANSRFLLSEGGWRGLVLDGSDAHVSTIRNSLTYWHYNLRAEQAFVTRENIDELLRQHGVGRDLGYLSIDIDGNDYWVWEAIQSVDPAIVSVEFNWRFGPDRAVTVPYDPDFVRQSAHPSWLYFGASLAALERLGARKGYALVAVSSSAVNAFFVKKELVSPTLPARSAGELWRLGRFSEFRDDSGRMVKLSEREQQELVLSLPLVEID